MALLRKEDLPFADTELAPLIQEVRDKIAFIMECLDRLHKDFEIMKADMQVTKRTSRETIQIFKDNGFSHSSTR